ncbi:MAG: ferritin family protein [candidate division Zixibacteria bacterium]
MIPANPKVLDALNWGISSEIKSYVFYLEAAQKTDNAEHKDTLLKLAAEEKEHYQVLERQHHSLITSEQWVTYNDILGQEGLPEIDENMAGQHRGLIDTVRNASDMRTVLDIAFDLEKEANGVFSKAAEDADDPEQKKSFEFLAKFERGHMNLIRKMIDSL